MDQRTMEMVKLFGLAVPRRRRDGGCPDIGPRATAAWLDRLPMADAVESARRIKALLDQVNGAVVPAPARFKFLEKLREPVWDLIEAMAAGVVGRDLPLTTKGLLMADLMRDLHGALAMGYKIIVVEILDGSARHDKKLLVRTLHRALAEHIRVLLDSYRLYSPAPRQLWQEMHLLYFYAEAKGLESTEIADPHSDAGIPQDISGMYKNALLVALGDPYRLRQNEAEKAYAALRRRTGEAKLTGPAGAAAGTNRHYCRLNTDLPPGPEAPLSDRDIKYCRILDLTQLVATMRAELARDPDQATGVDRNRSLDDLSRRLLQAWEGRSRRGFSRIRRVAPLELGIGFHAAHHLVAAGGETEATEAEPPKPPQRKLDPLIDTHTEFSIAPLPSQLQRYRDSQNPGTLLAIRAADVDETGNNWAEPRRASYTAQPWRTLNISAGGYCVLWDHNTPSAAQVGELVGIREGSADQARWSIGVVRWMKYDASVGVKLGIEILAPQASAATGQPLQKNVNGESPFNCLRLPEVQAMNQPATLLIPALRHRVGDDLAIREHDRSIGVRLTNELENTGNFARFQYARLGDQTRGGTYTQPTATNARTREL